MLNVFVNLLRFTHRATGVSGSVRGEYPSHRVVPSPAKPALAALLLCLGTFFSAMSVHAIEQTYQLRDGNFYTVTVTGDNVTVVGGEIHVLIQTPYTITISATAGYGWIVVQPNPNPTSPFDVKYINSPELGKRQIGYVEFKELDGAEAVIGTPVMIVVDAEIQLLGKRLVTHNPAYEKDVVLALPTSLRDIVVRQVTVMHNNQVKVLAKVPADCTVSLGWTWAYNWACDAEGPEGTESGLDVYYFRTHHPSTQDARDTAGEIKVNRSAVFPGSYIVAIRHSATGKCIKVGGTLKVGPMVTGLMFTQAIDRLDKFVPNAATDKMNTMCPYTYPVMDVKKNVGYGLAINYTLDDVAAKMEFKFSDLAGGDLGGSKVLGEKTAGGLESVGAHKAKWEGFDTTIPENADEIVKFPEQNIQGNAWIAPVHVVKEARYQHDITATLKEDPSQEQLFRIEFEVKYEAK